MHKNTFVTIAGLSVIAALLFGINVGRKLPDWTKGRAATVARATPTPEAEAEEIAIATPTPAPTPKEMKVLGADTALQEYTNAACGYTISFPTAWQYTELASTATTLTNANDANEQITIVCQKNLPRPEIESKLIESTEIDGVNAELYHDQNPETGQMIDAAIVKTPDKAMDVLISGYGSVFEHVLATFNFVEAEQPTSQPTAQPTPPQNPTEPQNVE